MKGVKKAFDGFVYEYGASDKDQNEVSMELARMLRLRYKNDAPRRPPRIILLGPPGSGRGTQAKIISKRFGLVHVSARGLIKEEVARKPELAKVITAAMNDGKLVPASIIIPLVEQRLKQSDCRVNGWVLDGFPQNEAQINLLKSLKITPSLVCMFEQPENETIRRLVNSKIDQETGLIYNMDIGAPSDESILARLAALPDSNETNVKARVAQWNANVHHIEDSFKDKLFTVQADQPIDQVTEVITDVILNPIF